MVEVLLWLAEFALLWYQKFTADALANDLLPHDVGVER